MATKITLIAAMAMNRVIGINNTLPWDLPEDLQHFREQTMGKPVVMGRKTFESIGRPLPGRNNIVISRNSSLEIDGVTIVGSIDEAIEAAGVVPEVMVIGGASLYELALPMADKMVLTIIGIDPVGDAKFPEWNPLEWTPVWREDRVINDPIQMEFSFLTLERRW